MDTTPDLRAFFADYRTTFARLDRDALLPFFSLPVQVVSATNDATSISVFDAESWPSVLDGLLGAYRILGVADAEPLQMDVTQVTPQVLSAHVRWELRRHDGSVVYGFSAVYTVVEVDGALRICAIAHDELPRLDAALGAGS